MDEMERIASIQARHDAQHREPEAIVIRASDVKPRELDPVWNGVLWAGKPTLIAGDPGLGKSIVTCDMAARVTTGEPWPCTVEARTPASVVMLSAEDDIEDTIVPRLIAAGADLSRVTFINGVTDYSGDAPAKAWLSLDKHVEQLASVLRAQRGQVRLLVIDPISAYMGRDVDSHRNSDVRTVLAGLADLASQHRAAVLVVTHLRKSDSSTALYRVTGSLAFTAAARAVYAVAKDPDDDHHRLMVCAKNNLAVSTMGFGYVVKANDDAIPYVEWGETPELRSLDEIFGQEQESPREAARNQRADEIAGWLNTRLSSGPVPATAMWESAKENGYSERDVRTAKRALKVRAEIMGFQGNWHWMLPNGQAGQMQ